MTAPNKQLHLALMLSGTGGHMGAWRLPDASYGPENFSHFKKYAKMAEDAKFDMLFVADAPVSLLGAGDLVRLEAMTMLAGLAAVTEKIGLGATVSTTYSQPYNLARMMGSIDHMSGGRAGWNVVTTSPPEAAGNFGDDAETPKAVRYERAAEFVQVAKGLWDSWEDDAIVADKESGVLADMTKRHPLNHEGKHLSVTGPLNMSRPPQGYPVILQAGASEIGIPFAAQIGEVIFTVQENAETTKAFGDRLRTLAAENGRNPDHLIIMPGVCPFVAETEEKAKQMLWDLSDYIDPAAAWAKLRSRLGVEVEHLDPEGPIPVIPWEEMRGHAKTLSAVAAKNNFNLRQIRDYAAAASGHRLLFGTPEMVADDLEHWFRSGAADGFIIIPPALPGPLEAFINGVLPILQERGLFRTEYTGSTLREHLGLPRPAHPRAQ
ncbi:LLM class flavin-dependent oxidoreductase [Sphingobium sp. H39-3-25]|uniref:LLM class flavin-dependent oxidoreductase n=1 Tax=Sphingobium arseniciresistens TaxID=3030834 RepID=UPI0023B8FD1F|nr:LLM class flavin-dependent oxidoreductase [Sphingobium arseniciresistens]